MNEEQIMQLIAQMKKQFKAAYSSKTDEEIEHMILDVFFETYATGKMNREDLTTLTNAMGYEVKDDVLDEYEGKVRKEEKAPENAK